MKKYISVTQFADKFGISERTARNYCACGKIEGALPMSSNCFIIAVCESGDM